MGWHAVIPRYEVTPPSQGKAAASADKGNQALTDFLGRKITKPGTVKDSLPWQV